jgi:hypothetical protein
MEFIFYTERKELFLLYDDELYAGVIAIRVEVDFPH